MKHVFIYTDGLCHEERSAIGSSCDVWNSCLTNPACSQLNCMQFISCPRSHGHIQRWRNLSSSQICHLIFLIFSDWSSHISYLLRFIISYLSSHISHLFKFIISYFLSSQICYLIFRIFSDLSSHMCHLLRFVIFSYSKSTLQTLECKDWKHNLVQSKLERHEKICRELEKEVVFCWL